MRPLTHSLLIVFAAFFACAGAAHAQNMPFELSADDVTFDISSSKVVATGGQSGQVVVSGTEGIVRSDRMIYDLETEQLSAEGNVTYADPDGSVLSVEKLDLSGDLKAGTMEQLRLRVPVIGEVAKARTATVDGSTYILTDVEYSPCKTCEGETKPWSISADKVTYDQQAGNMTYNSAVMDVYGVPVMYLPWFRHQVGPKRAKSGLLLPQFGKSTTLGDQVTLSGYINSPAENADYTLRSRLMSDRGAQLQIERRQVGVDSMSEIRGSYLNDNGVGRVRNHLAVIAQKDLTPTRRIGINGEIANDDTYLNQFFSRNDPYLASTVFGEDAGPQHYAALSMTRFQDLDSTKDPARTAQVYPHLQVGRWFALDSGGQLDFDADFTSIHRDLGTKSRRMIGSGKYELPLMLGDGSKLTLGATGRLDFYSVEDSTINNQNDGMVTRVLPEGTVTWEKPYISAGGYHTMAPTVKLALSPRGGNLNGKVPNEDSVAYELDTGNLFESSRFAGVDRVETGPRVIYGLDNRWGDADRTAWRLFVGQSLRKFDDATLPQSGGASTKNSDWVGLIEANPSDWFTLNNRFRLDNATFSPRRLDSGMRLGYLKKANLLMTHTFLDGGAQEMNSELKLPLTDTWAFKARTQHDLANDRLLLGEAGFSWLRDCYMVELTARRRGFINGDVQPSTDYILNLQLLSLGGEE